MTVIDLTLQQIKNSLPIRTITNGDITILIPDEVLENQAFWVLYNKLATVDHSVLNCEGFHFDINPDDSSKIILTQSFRNFGSVNELPGFESVEAIEDAEKLLGGEQSIIRQLSAGDLYSKWLADQIYVKGSN